MRTRRLAAALVLTAVALAGCSGSEAGRTSTATPQRAVPTQPAVTSPPRSVAGVPPISARARPAAAGIPPISARARAAGLRDARTVVPDAVIDLRYATRHNFTKIRLYPKRARCLVHKSMARGLAAAGRAARKAGLRLVFWDCYRPHSVQKRMYKVVSNPNWVARPGRYARSHEAGRSVDVTLARGTRYLDMGTGFDNFTPRATAYATKGVTARAERNRALLRKIMGAGKFAVYSGEWWHFDGRGADRNRPHLKAPVH